MEKNKLYKVNKWNKPAFMREGNVFDGFNYPSQQMQIAPSFNLDYNKINQRLGALGANVNNSLAQNSGIKGASTGGGGIGNMLYGTAAALGRSIGANDQFKRGLYDRLDPLFYLADGKESTVGNALSDAGVSLFETGASTGNGPLMIAGGAAKALGSFWNAAAGISWNNDLIDSIKANTQQAQATGKAFGDVDTSQAFFNTSGNMVNGIDFDWDDLGSTGFLRSNDSLKNEASSLKGKQKTALAYQLKGMGDAAERVDSIMDDNVFGNFAAFGGYVPTIGAGTEDMPAINFGMWQDWLTGLNKRRKQASDNREANDYTNIGMGMRYDFGGDMQTNSADYSVGKVYDVSKEEANRLKAMGYEFTVVN